MSYVDLENDEWSAVQVGPIPVGWVGPNRSFKDGKRYADITILMGDKQFKLSPYQLVTAFYKNAAHTDNNVPRMLDYNKCFCLRVPVDSLDISQTGEIVYSEHSMDTLYAALSNLFSALTIQVQSELNAKETPVEVVRQCAELLSYGYVNYFFQRMMWRGTKLEDLFQDSEMMVCVTAKNDVVPFTSSHDRHRYIGFGKIRSINGSTLFRSFIDWQVRTHFDNGNTAPANVFLIRASSAIEHEQGAYICQSDFLLKKFLAATGRADVSDATFFLAPIGDPLEEWVDGEVLSVKEFADLSGFNG